MKLRATVLVLALAFIGAIPFVVTDLDLRLAGRNAAFRKLFPGATDFTWVMVNVDSTEVQGDAHLLLDRSGNAVLVDTGLAEEGRAHLLPYLKQLDIRRLDTVLITHPHFDHYGGLEPLLEDAKIQIGEIYLGTFSDKICDGESPGCSRERLARIQDLAKHRGIPIKDYTQWSDIGFANGTVLHKLFQFSEATTPLPWTDINDMSFIARLTHGNSTALFTGDLNRRLSEWLVSKYPEDFKADILKVPHHGTESLATDSFLDSVAAHVYLVPSPATLWCSDRSARVRTRSLSKNIATYVNGVHGNVIVKFSPKGFVVESERDVSSDAQCPS